MNKIKSLNLVNLNNGAHFIFMRTVVEQVATETAITGNTVAKTAIEDLKTALKKENEVYALSKANRNTATIAETDRVRDDVLMGYKQAVKSFLRFPVADMAEAARLLLQNLKDYDIDPDMQLDRETGAIFNLIGDCEGKNAALVSKLGLGAHVAQLKLANTKVEELLNVRDKEHSTIEVKAMKTARRNSDKAYRRFVEVINSLINLGMGEGFEPFVLFVNERIERYEKEVLPKAKGDTPAPDKPQKPGKGKGGAEVKPKDKDKTDKKPDGEKPAAPDDKKPGEHGSVEVTPKK